MAVIETKKIGHSYREAKMSTHRMLAKMGAAEKERKKFGRAFANAEAARLNGADSISESFGNIESDLLGENINGNIKITLDERERPTYMVILRIQSPNPKELQLLQLIRE